MVYQHLPPQASHTPGGMPVQRRRRDGARPSAPRSTGDQPVHPGALARIAGRLSRVFRTRS
jgi:hypothetical protein